MKSSLQVPAPVYPTHPQTTCGALIERQLPHGLLVPELTEHHSDF